MMETDNKGRPIDHEGRIIYLARMSPERQEEYSHIRATWTMTDKQFRSFCDGLMKDA